MLLSLVQDAKIILAVKYSSCSSLNKKKCVKFMSRQRKFLTKI